MQPSAHQKKMAKVKGASVLLGLMLGLIVPGVYLAGQGTDAGLLFIPLVIVTVPLGIIILYLLSTILFEERKEKMRAIKWLIIIALLIAAFVGYTYYQDNMVSYPEDSNELRGEVIGPNSENIPKDKLPLCQPGPAGGINDTPQPCFSPEDAIYL